MTNKEVIDYLLQLDQSIYDNDVEKQSFILGKLILNFNDGFFPPSYYAQKNYQIDQLNEVLNG